MEQCRILLTTEEAYKTFFGEKHSSWSLLKDEKRNGYSLYTSTIVSFSSSTLSIHISNSNWKAVSHPRCLQPMAYPESTKLYYWLKLHKDFFDKKQIKALRKYIGENRLIIIFLKLQLKYQNGLQALLRWDIRRFCR